MKENILTIKQFNEFINWDVKQFLSRSLKSHYTIDRLGNYIIHQTKKYKLSDFPDKKFIILGVSNKIGMFDGDVLEGKNIKQKYHKVENNWIAYNPYRVNVGSIGLKTKDIKGEYISPAYVVFSCNEKLLPEFLLIMMKTKAFNEMIRNSTTGTVRQTLGFDNLAEINIPIPSIEKQTIIIDKYNYLISKYNKCKQNVEIYENEIESFIIKKLSISNDVMNEEDNNRIVKIKKFSNLIHWGVENNSYKIMPNEVFYSNKYQNVLLTDICEFNPTTSFAKDGDLPITFIPMENVSEDGEIIKCNNSTANFSKGYTKFLNGDVIWAKITPCMQNGKSAIVNKLINGKGCGSTEFNVFRAIKNKAIPEYIYILLRTKRIRNIASHYLSGTCGQQRVRNTFFSNMVVPNLSIEQQKNFTNEVLELYKKKVEAKKAAEAFFIDAENYFQNEIYI